MSEGTGKTNEPTGDRSGLEEPRPGTEEGRGDGSPDLYGRCLTMWSIQDSLLQSYRNLMLTSQSIMLGIAIVSVQSRYPLIAFIPAIPAFLLNRSWQPLARSRGFDVFYFQWQMLRLEAHQQIRPDVLTGFKEWQRLTIKDRHVRLCEDPIGRELLGSPTRRKLDEVIPRTFRFCWLPVLLFALAATLRNIGEHFHVPGLGR